MKPLSIEPHPDAPNAMVVMKAPPSMGEDCMDLTTRIVIALDGDAQITDCRIVHVPGSEDRRYPGFLSEWEATEEECKHIAEQIAAGKRPRFRMLVVGGALPPTNLWVRGDHEA